MGRGGAPTVQLQGPGTESAGRMGHVGSLVGGGAPAAAQGTGSDWREGFLDHVVSLVNPVEIMSSAPVNLVEMTWSALVKLVESSLAVPALPAALPSSSLMVPSEGNWRVSWELQPAPGPTLTIPCGHVVVSLRAPTSCRRLLPRGPLGTAPLLPIWFAESVLSLAGARH